MQRPRPILAMMQWSFDRIADLRPAPTATEQRGRNGERTAYFHLRRQGYIVVARRWRTALLDGEVDLIAWHRSSSQQQTLCFIEVKTRSADAHTAAEFNIDSAKQKALQRMARAYVSLLPRRGGLPAQVALRFDVVSVYLRSGHSPQVRVQTDAFH